MFPGEERSTLARVVTHGEWACLSALLLEDVDRGYTSATQQTEQASWHGTKACSHARVPVVWGCKGYFFPRCLVWL